MLVSLKRQSSCNVTNGSVMVGCLLLVEVLLVCLARQLRRLLLTACSAEASGDLGFSVMNLSHQMCLPIYGSHAELCALCASTPKWHSHFLKFIATIAWLWREASMNSVRQPSHFLPSSCGGLLPSCPSCEGQFYEVSSAN